MIRVVGQFAWQGAGKRLDPDGADLEAPLSPTDTSTASLGPVPLESLAAIERRARAARRLRFAFPCFVDFQHPTLKLGAVETRDGFWNHGRVTEGHECKPARLPRRAVNGKEDFGNVAHSRE